MTFLLLHYFNIFLLSLITFSILLVLPLCPDLATSYSPTTEVNPNKNSTALSINLNSFLYIISYKTFCHSHYHYTRSIPLSTYHIIFTSSLVFFSPKNSAILTIINYKYFPCNTFIFCTRKCMYLGIL